MVLSKTSLFRKYRCLCTCLAMIMIITYTSYSTLLLSELLPSIQLDDSLNDTSCYETKDVFLEPVGKQIFPNKTIFFLESSCRGRLNSRQACSVESAAKANPNWQVVVLVAGPLSSDFIKSKAYVVLSNINNIRFLRLNVQEFVHSTPVEQIFSNGIINQSSYPVVHASDILRIVTLYKYGGVYLDLDVLVIKSFDTLPNNFIGKQLENDVASGVLGISKDDVGNNFSTTALRDLTETYKPKTWAGNGPDLILRTLQKTCNTSKLIDMSADSCRGMYIFGPKYFYPIFYSYWKTYFQETPLNKVSEETYAHHIWNALSSKTTVPRNSIYAELAKQFCPDVFKAYDDHFGE